MRLVLSMKKFRRGLKSMAKHFKCCKCLREISKWSFNKNDGYCDICSFITDEKLKRQPYDEHALDASFVPAERLHIPEHNIKYSKKILDLLERRKVHGKIIFTLEEQ
jgi:hypothetical protein